MIPVVPDTNIPVSALLPNGGNEARPIAVGEAGEPLPCRGSTMLARYAIVLGRARFAFEHARHRRMPRFVRDRSLLVEPAADARAAPARRYGIAGVVGAREPLARLPPA